MHPMKRAVGKGLDILLDGVLFITVSYALLNMMSLFRSGPAYVLFFAANVVGIGKFYDSLRKRLGRWYWAAAVEAAAVALLLGVCFLTGYVDGELTSF